MSQMLGSQEWDVNYTPLQREENDFIQFLAPNIVNYSQQTDSTEVHCEKKSESKHSP